MLTNENYCDIIIDALGICVMVAQQTLTLYVWVRALDPQPTQRTPSGVLFALAGDLLEHSFVFGKINKKQF